MPSSDPQRARPKALVAWLLALVAGCVDVLAWLSLGDGFVSHLSGDTVHAARALSQGRIAFCLYRLLPLPGFIAGAALGRTLADATRARGYRHRLTLMLLLEGAVLALASGTHARARLVAIALGALAMGLQNAALRHVAGHRLRTTFITGMLVAFADECVAVGVHGQRDHAFSLWLHAGVWLAFAVGAVIGALTWPAQSALAALVIYGVLTCVIAWDLVSPVAPS